MSAVFTLETLEKGETVGTAVGAKDWLGFGKSYENPGSGQKSVKWSLGESLDMTLYRSWDASLLWSLS